MSECADRQLDQNGLAWQARDVSVDRRSRQLERWQLAQTVIAQDLIRAQRRGCALDQEERCTGQQDEAAPACRVGAGTFDRGQRYEERDDHGEARGNAQAVHAWQQVTEQRVGARHERVSGEPNRGPEREARGSDGEERERNSRLAEHGAPARCCGC